MSDVDLLVLPGVQVELTATTTGVNLCVGTTGGGGTGPDPSNTNPAALGVASPGVSLEYARGEHVHPQTGMATDAELAAVAATVQGNVGPTGAVAESVPRWLPNLAGQNVLTSGTLAMFGLWLPSGLTVSSITFITGGSGFTLPTNQWFGLFNGSRAALALTANDAATAWGATTFKTLALTAPYVTTYTGLHYVGCLVTAGGMAPLIAASGNANLVAATPRIIGDSTTGLTTPPALPFTAAALTSATVHRPYFYLS